MNEHKDNLASNFSNDKVKIPVRKEPKQISFRVSEQEYSKLKQSAETLNITVPNFVKKKAQGSRLVSPKLDKETRQSIAKDLSHLGSNVNQIAKWFNQNKDKATHLPEHKYHDLEMQFDDIKKELHRIWQQLN